MRSKVFNILFSCLLSVPAFSQYRLSGTVSSREDSTAVKECIIYLNDEKKSAITDSRGRFLFNDLEEGNYILHFTSLEFEYQQFPVRITDKDEAVRIQLSPRTQTLAE